MSKFNVGDKVKILDGSKIDDYRGLYVYGMKKYVGKEYEVDDVYEPSKFVGYGYSLNGIPYTWDERGLELVNPIPKLPKIEILPKKNGKVSAILYNGDKYVKSANAKCNPTDTYDFNTGSELAFKRLLGIEGKPVIQPTVKEVPRHAKVGEYVKIVKAKNVPSDNGVDAYKNGEILKIISENCYISRFKEETAKNGLDYILHDSEYVVLENYNPNSADNGFDWEKFKKPDSKIAIHCPTEELAKDFLQKCDEHGIKWCSGSKTNEKTLWNTYKEKTSYRCDSYNLLSYADAPWYRKKGYTVVEWTTNGTTVTLSSFSNEELIAELINRLNK